MISERIFKIFSCTISDGTKKKDNSKRWFSHIQVSQSPRWVRCISLINKFSGKKTFSSDTRKCFPSIVVALPPFALTEVNGRNSQILGECSSWLASDPRPVDWTPLFPHKTLWVELEPGLLRKQHVWAMPLGVCRWVSCNMRPGFGINWFAACLGLEMSHTSLLSRSHIAKLGLGTSRHESIHGW